MQNDTEISDEEGFKLPKPFMLRRLHSILGMWLVIYLFEHLLVNSQAALYFLDDGYGFIAAVNKLEDLPYLPVIELVFLGVPFFIHGLWGIIYLKTAKLNAHRTDGAKPALPQYKRNRAYSWQRITSVLLIFFIIAHVVQMRFLERPLAVVEGLEKHYVINVKKDPGLSEVAATLDAQVSEVAHKRPLKKNQVVVITKNVGSAFYLMMRETFKSPVMVILYSIFVVAASYHAFNGMWTFLITWGVTLSARAQRRSRTLTNILMTLSIIMGLMAVWGTYWTVQFQV